MKTPRSGRSGATGSEIFEGADEVFSDTDGFGNSEMVGEGEGEDVGDGDCDGAELGEFTPNLPTNFHTIFPFTETAM